MVLTMETWNEMMGILKMGMVAQAYVKLRQVLLALEDRKQRKIFVLKELHHRLRYRSLLLVALAIWTLTK